MKLFLRSVLLVAALSSAVACEDTTSESTGTGAGADTSSADGSGLSGSDGSAEDAATGGVDAVADNDLAQVSDTPSLVDTASTPDVPAVQDTQTTPDVPSTPDVPATPDVAADVAPAGPSDPNLDGPNTYKELDAKALIVVTGDTVAVHAAYPTGGPTAGPYPLIILAHGFQLDPKLYTGYLQRLATFGYVAMSVDFPTSFLGNDNQQESKDLSGAIDWAIGNATLGPLVNKDLVGVTGHSLGGKLAFLAASIDARFDAAFGMDPVDGGGPTGCNAPQCADVSALMPSLKIPTAFVGETTDSAGGFQPCAPAANNFQTFYAGATTPALQVTVNGANHMSFLDTTNGCLTCGFCNKATLAQNDATALTRSFMVAFFERHLRGLTFYDDYLTGATAQARYVAKKIATIESK